MRERYTHPFEPIIFGDTEVLILGTFPSLASFGNDFYYAHPKNQFWKILSAVTSYPVNNRDQKIWLLRENRLGLWDMISSCSRENSSDGKLRDIIVNDIPALLSGYPSITRVLFTGRKAHELFEKHFGDHPVKRAYLPSPSPAYALMSLEKKIEIYSRYIKTGRSGVAAH